MTDIWADPDQAMREIARRLLISREEKGAFEAPELHLDIRDSMAIMAAYREEPKEECKHLEAVPTPESGSTLFFQCDCGASLTIGQLIANLRAALNEEKSYSKSLDSNFEIVAQQRDEARAALKEQEEVTSAFAQENKRRGLALAEKDREIERLKNDLGQVIRWVLSGDHKHDDRPIPGCLLPENNEPTEEIKATSEAMRPLVLRLAEQDREIERLKAESDQVKEGVAQWARLVKEGAKKP